MAPGSDAGPCERHLLDAVSRTAPLVRAAVVGVAGGFGLIAYPVGEAVVAAVWVAVMVALAVVQTRFPQVAPLHLVLSVAVGLGQVWLGAQPIGGWIVTAASVTSAICYFEWPERTVWPHVIAVATIAAYVVGCVLAGGGVVPATFVPFLMQAGLAWVGLRLAVRAARGCDVHAARAARRRMAAAITSARRAAHRAHLAILHDTASTTFLMVSTDTTGEFGWLPAQARRDLDALTGPPPETEGEVDLAELARSLPDDFPDLRLDLTVHGPLVLPSGPAFAIYHGLREALTNVRRHAGKPTATLTAHDHDGRTVVCLRDHGPGFDPTAVPCHRRGLSDSIQARMTAVAGRAQIRSVLGKGTSVEWTWPDD